MINASVFLRLMIFPRSAEYPWNKQACSLLSMGFCSKSFVCAVVAATHSRAITIILASLLAREFDGFDTYVANVNDDKYRCGIEH